MPEADIPRTLQLELISFSAWLVFGLVFFLSATKKFDYKEVFLSDKSCRVKAYILTAKVPA